MPNIHANTEAISGAAGNVQQTVQQLEEALQAVSARVQSLESEYSGPDGSALQTLFSEYRAQAVALNTTLQQIGVAMNTAATNYADASAASTQTFST